MMWRVLPVLLAAFALGPSVVTAQTADVIVGPHAAEIRAGEPMVIPVTAKIPCPTPSTGTTIYRAFFTDQETFEVRFFPMSFDVSFPPGSCSVPGYRAVIHTNMTVEISTRTAPLVPISVDIDLRVWPRNWTVAPSDIRGNASARLVPALILDLRPSWMNLNATIYEDQSANFRWTWENRGNSRMRLEFDIVNGSAHVPALEPPDAIELDAVYEIQVTQFFFHVPEGTLPFNGSRMHDLRFSLRMVADPMVDGSNATVTGEWDILVTVLERSVFRSPGAGPLLIALAVLGGGWAARRRRTPP